MQNRAPLIVGAFAAGVMVIAIIYGMASGDFVDSLQDIAGQPWGVVTLVDLGAGLVLIGAWIAWRERSIGRAVPWWIAMALTGNLATGIYVITAARQSTTVPEFLTGDGR